MTTDRDHAGRATQVAAAIVARLTAGQVIDLDAMAVEYEYDNYKGLADKLNRLRRDGIRVCRVNPRKHKYALEGSAAAKEAAGKYAGSPVGGKTRIVPVAWDPARVNHSKIAPGLAPSPVTQAPPPDYGTMITAAVKAGVDAYKTAAAQAQAVDPAAVVAEAFDPSPVAPSPAEYDPGPAVDLVAMAEAAHAPIKVIIICPEGCNPPQVLVDGKALYIDAGDRQIDHKILT